MVQRLLIAMDWNLVLNFVFGGTTLIGVVQAVRYRKQNKALKDVEAQRAQIDLAELYKDKVIALLNEVSTKQDGGNANQQKMLEKLDTLDTRTEKVEIKISDIEEYLDGDFNKWKSQKQKPKRKKEVKIVNEGEEDHE